MAGHDPDTGRPRGRLRTDGRAVRFVEVVVNGPKSWSLAAALHPDVTAAYAAAQDRAAVQVIHWLAQHATSRVGPRGKQVQLPVEMLEAVTRGGLVRGPWRRRRQSGRHPPRCPGPPAHGAVALRLRWRTVAAHLCRSTGFNVLQTPPFGSRPGAP